MTDKMMDALFAGAKRAELSQAAKVAPTLSFKEGVGILSFEALTLSTFEAGKKVPARHRWDGKNLRFDPTREAIDYVRRQWPDVIILKTIPAYEKLTRPAPAPAPVRGQMSWRRRHEPFDHQQRAFDLSAMKDEFAYLMDMGTGKSKSAVDDAAFAFARGEIDRVLVIAPNGVHTQWIDEVLPQHWPLELPCRRDAIETGKRKPEWWGDWGANPRDCKWLAVNIENLKVINVGSGRRKEWALDGLAAELIDFIEAGPCLIILDESHKIKNPKAVRTIACWKLGKKAVRRRILTGSPIAKGLEDYYAQFRFLNPSIIGVYTFAGFKQQFCVMGGFNGKVITGYRDTAEFHSRIADYSFRVEKSEVLDLPPKMYMERTCDLTPEQRRVLNELKQELMTELSDGTRITVQQVVQRMLRLQQVTQGYLPYEDGGHEIIPDNRLPLLMDMLENVPDRTVIWCRFNYDIDRIMAELGGEAIAYRGQNKVDRPRDKEAWLHDTSKRFFVGNPQAGGTGLDWLMKNGPVSTVIYYSNSFNSIDRWQSEDRTHRFGLKGTVSYYDIVCRGTLDRALLRNLKSKRDLKDMSLEELKQIVSGI